MFDHHPIRPQTRSARFHDIRSRYGATSRILYEYLKAAKLEVGGVGGLAAKPVTTGVLAKAAKTAKDGGALAADDDDGAEVF